MILKSVLRYDNAPVIEASWVQQVILPQQEIEPGVYDAVMRTQETVVKCRAYGVAEFGELRADLGADAPQYESLLAEVEATYVPPDPEPVPVPDSCSPAQGLVALFALKGITETDIHTAITGIPDPVQRYTAQIAFNKATEWRRDSQSTQMLASLMSLTETDLDSLFAYAVNVAV